MTHDTPAINTIAPAIVTPREGEVLDALRAYGPSTIPVLARVLGRCVSYVARTIGDLVRCGLVDDLGPVARGDRRGRLPVLYAARDYPTVVLVRRRKVRRVGPKRQREVLALLTERPLMTVAEMAACLGRDVGYVRPTIRNLTELGLVAVAGEIASGRRGRRPLVYALVNREDYDA